MTTSRKDFTQVAFRVAQIATGEIEPDKPLSGKKVDSLNKTKKIFVKKTAHKPPQKD